MGRFIFERDQRISLLESELRERKSERIDVSENMPAEFSALHLEIQRLKTVTAGQEKMVLERWEAIQEMGRFIFERDQHIASLQQKLEQLEIELSRLKS